MDLSESPLRKESGIAMSSFFGKNVPRKTVCTVDDALFELLLRGLEMGTRIHGTCNESANIRVWQYG